MIEVRNLVKTYTDGSLKVEALKGIDMKISKGEIFGVIGLSGAGKSSLVRCISSIERPTEGTIIIDGVDITALSEKELIIERRKIGMVFQLFNLMENRTVFENIAFGLEIMKYDRAFIKERVTELMELVGLSERKDSYPAMLSGGQKQRVGIARALSNHPKILICDEATSALDPVTTKSILDLLKEINKTLNLTILIITHEMEVIKSICDKVSVIENGLIIETGSVIDVFVNPKTETAKYFFEDKNLRLSHSVYEKILLSDNKVVKVNFIGDTSVNPYISYCVKNYDVNIAILAGNIQEVNQTIIGTLIVEIIGSQEETEKAISYFNEENLIVEVINNVS